jgi:tetratricopeptide (TPR) repeat protein
MAGKTSGDSPVRQSKNALVLVQKAPSDLLALGCRDLADLNGHVRNRAMLQQAARQYRSGAFRRAWAIFKQVLRKDRNEQAAWEGCGFCAFQLGQYRKAQTYLNQVRDRLSRCSFHTSQGTEMVYVPASRFHMGATEGELAFCWEAELTNQAREQRYPRDEVEIKMPRLRRTVEQRYTRRLVRLNAFSMANTTITSTQYREWQRDYSTRSRLCLDHHPALVDWQQAVDFCQWLTRREHRLYRLPTEAEWEYVARRQSIQKKSNREPDPNPRFPDLRRKVFQWCIDIYSDTYPAEADEVDPFGPHEGDEHVVRGGTYACRKNNVCIYPWGRRASDRTFDQVTHGMPHCYHLTGLRLVCVCDRPPLFLEYLSSDSLQA